jgi:hypothetical protein
MRTLKEFKSGDGAHCGLTDWYPEKEAALQAALTARAPFDTGWYGSKKEIASARIWSDDGVTVSVEVSVSDDFDTAGTGSESTTDWTLESVAAAITHAWVGADQDRDDNAPYTGFAIIDPSGAWVETYILGNGEFDTPPGDNYHWWGWQHDEVDDVGVPDPNIPGDIVGAFESYVVDWERPAELTVRGWTIRPWWDG